MLAISVLVAATCASPVRAQTNGVIVHPSQDAAGRQQLFAVNPDGSGHRQLTTGAMDAGMPAWSPDGQHIAYSIYSPLGLLTVNSMGADGSDKRSLALGYAPAWSVTNRIAFVRPPAIWSMNPDGRDQRQLTFPPAGVEHLHPAWAPDGGMLAYVEVTPLATGWKRVEIWTMTADGAHQRQITFPGHSNYDSHGNFINAADDANSPAWSPSGTLCFWSGVTQMAGQIWTMNADGSDRRQLTQDAAANNDDCDWSPDGAFILFDTSRRGINELWRMNADGTDPVPITPTRGGPFSSDAAWQPRP